MSSPVIVDHVEALSLTEEAVEKHFNELHSLRYLAEGLVSLSRQVRLIEQEVLKRIGNKRMAFVFGNAPEMQGVPQGLVACAFHWYAVSACNYARLVGWLVSGDPNQAGDYVRRVLPAVYVWRNKIAGHFSITDPREEDTPADLAASVLFPIGFQDDVFVASPLTLAFGGPKGGSKSREDMSWSLSKVHSELLQRYWPPASSLQRPAST